jgi:hypothetical protein
MNDDLIISGDGKTPETAVRFRPCHIRARVFRERLFISEKFGVEGHDWTEEMHYTSTDRHSVWVLALSDGTQCSVYFDTSQTIYDR